MQYPNAMYIMQYRRPCPRRNRVGGADGVLTRARNNPVSRPGALHLHTCWA